jgi:hypothetical protein
MITLSPVPTLPLSRYSLEEVREETVESYAKAMLKDRQIETTWRCS